VRRQADPRRRAAHLRRHSCWRPCARRIPDAHPGSRSTCGCRTRVDIVAEGIDIALRIADCRFLAARAAAGPVTGRIVGSPAYFEKHGAPAPPADLATHACFGIRAPPIPTIWRFRKAGRRGSDGAAYDGPLMHRQWRRDAAGAARGLGVARLPDFMVGEELASGGWCRC
jgi:DNA-binding transcriptional LysR family regulator